MDPFTLLIAGLGAIGSIAGGIGESETAQKEASIASQESGVSREITSLESAENSQRQLAMQINARQSMLRNARMTQLSMSQNLASAAASGAQFGSGLAGGEAQARTGGAFNQLGIQQNLDIGNTLFGIQSQITGNQMTMATMQGQQATLQGQGAMFGAIASIGGSMLNAAGPGGRLLGNFFGNANDPSVSGSTQGGMGLYSGAQTGNLY